VLYVFSIQASGSRDCAFGQTGMPGSSIAVPATKNLAMITCSPE
jgi:hypothetical protein